MAQAVDGLASKPYPGRRGETGVEFALVVYEYEDVFPEELPRLPPYRAWVEVRYRAHKSGFRGPRGVSAPVYLRLSQQISGLFRVCFYPRAYGQEYCSIL